MSSSTKKSLFFLIYVTSFLYAFQYALPLYIQSSFITQFLPTREMVGIIFTIAALFTTTLTFLFPYFLRKFGNYLCLLTFMGFQIVSLLVLGLSLNPYLVISFFIINQVLVGLMFVSLDEFVESFSEDSSTGKTRAVFMTIINIGIALAPLLASFLITNDGFKKIFLLAAVCMTLGFLIILKNFRNYKDPKYSIPSFTKTLHAIIENRDLRAVIYMHFLLSFFYTWMVIYTPIYLNIKMNIPLRDILMIITPIALLPFILFEFILGKIADTKLGEKELLFCGFFITGITTAGLYLINTTSILLWAGALFFTRVGACMIEVMTEAYFYKKVDSTQPNIISFMRTVRASAYIIAPLLGSLILLNLPYRYLFLILGIIMFTSLPYILKIQDTR